ncbi:trimeric intracellular cation channel family protein [Erythrobacteraceae bacterium CFH 75059]|uniref:trimeric intracellular cation channel family protein n=1 Tax=Qipengyuania thermophila TaxID=2509361 RepID=UPI0010211060|nr:trimeric intracellular cation channel family protein [Qipengyuania thermophila]TCD02070.1 trimeric intracellular cation channel family protein [Erythrobacteraceae bacterium CFH 75059]
MFAFSIAVLDWIGLVVFTITGALVASRQQMDVVGFVLLGTVTGIGGGTVRDLLLDRHPVVWMERPEYLVACVAVATAVFFTAHLASSRLRLILWFDAAGLALFATVGASIALDHGAAPVVAVTLGVITATFGGIIRDVLGQEDSIIFSREIYVTAALAAAATYVALAGTGVPRDAATVAALLAGFGLRAGALLRGWSLPRYRARPPAR